METPEDVGMPMDDFQFSTILRELSGINARLDRMNGRLGKAEIEVGVLADRSNRAERQGSIFGALGGGAATGAILLIKSWLNGGKP